MYSAKISTFTVIHSKMPILVHSHCSHDNRNTKSLVSLNSYGLLRGFCLVKENCNTFKDDCHIHEYARLSMGFTHTCAHTTLEAHPCRGYSHNISSQCLHSRQAVFELIQRGFQIDQVQRGKSQIKARGIVSSCSGSRLK